MLSTHAHTQPFFHRRSLLAAHMERISYGRGFSPLPLLWLGLCDAPDEPGRRVHVREAAEAVLVVVSLRMCVCVCVCAHALTCMGVHVYVRA